MQSATQALSKFGNIIIAGEFNKILAPKTAIYLKKLMIFVTPLT